MPKRNARIFKDKVKSAEEVLQFVVFNAFFWCKSLVALRSRSLSYFVNNWKYLWIFGILLFSLDIFILSMKIFLSGKKMPWEEVDFPRDLSSLKCGENWLTCGRMINKPRKERVTWESLQRIKTPHPKPFFTCLKTTALCKDKSDATSIGSLSHKGRQTQM